MSAAADDGGVRRIPAVVSRSLWLASAWTGCLAAALAMALGVSVAVVCWLPDAGVLGSPASAMRAGLLATLAAHHGGLTIDGMPVDFVPLAMTAVVGAIAWRAGAALAEVAAFLGDASGRRLAAAAAVQTGCYVGCLVVAVPLATLGTTSAPATRTGVAAAIVFAMGTSAALCGVTPAGHRLTRRLSRSTRQGLRGAAAAVSVLLLAGALLTAGSLVTHADRVTALSRLVGGGFSGVPLTVLGLLTTPNAAVAAAAYLTGPGFTVGAGTSVDAFSTTHGRLPAFPLLGAVPTGPGGTVTVLVAMAVTLAGAGGAAAACVRRLPLRAALRAVLVSALGAGAALGVLGWLGGGALGADRLRTVGASPWRLAVAVAVEVALVAWTITLGWRLARRITRRGRDGAERDDVSTGAALETVGTGAAE